MEMERYKTMTDEQLREEYQMNPEFEYMKLTYQLSGLPLAVTSCGIQLYFEHDFRIFKKFVRGQIKLPFSIEMLLHLDSRKDDSAVYVNKYLRQGKLDIRKFWWAIVFIAIYSDSIFKGGVRLDKSFLEKLDKIADILSEENATLICKSDTSKKLEFKDGEFLAQMSNALKCYISETIDIPDNWQIEHFSIPIAPNKQGGSYRQMFNDCHLYIALFKKLEADGILPKQSFDRYIMLAELMKFTKRTYNANFDKEDISGILNNKEYKSNPKGGLESNLIY